AFNIVLCVDSLLSERRLGQLESDGALKTDEVPAGLQPAEAGVALLLSSQPDGGIGSIVAIGELDEAPLANPDDVYTGAALDRLLAAAEHKLGPEVGAHPWVISDQNGEAWRAFDWGSALSRLVGRQSPYAATQPWFPAIQFGDTGSVTGAIGIVTALGAFSRHYAPHPVATILDSDANKRTAIMLRAGKAS
ncbi:MAG: hypothetical protein KJO55_03900, partial [Gammaproteobacteria bacterium]|nr:hypothetical protein [Gammaproteobacteria bacterium]